MGCRFGICDLRRTAISIILSQDRVLAAVTDILGRVSLIDCQKGIVLRLFKGYREAQCAFIQIPDEKKTKHRANRKNATFLIIYSPKKGTLEIFLAQQGLKIATFTASKFSVLHYISYGLVGFTITSKSKYVCQFTCILIDPDGQIKEIVIPFHFALTEKNSKRARDLHLYRRLKQFIKTSDFSLENFASEALTTCMEIKTCEVQLQCLQLLTSSREIQPEIILKCVEFLAEKTLFLEGEDISNDMKALKIHLHNFYLLIHFYVFVNEAHDGNLDKENGNEINTNKPNEELSTQLYLGDKVINNLQKLLDLSTLNNNKKSMELKVSFYEDNEFNFCEFISIFDLTKNDNIYLKANIGQATLFKISELIFKQYILENRNDYEDLKNEIVKSCLINNDLFQMILNYWVNRPLNIDVHLEIEMQNLSQLIYILSKLEQVKDITVEYNESSRFWTEIREILANSSKPFPALTAALICRSVAQKIEYEKELQQSGTSLEDENIEIWEKLSQENCEWMLLIGKLEDVSLLNIILSTKPCITDSECCTLPKLKYNPVDVSLKYILEKGKGIVSELVAQWLTTVGVTPESIVLNEETSCTIEKEYKEASNSAEVVDNINKVQPIFEHLNIIKKQFPYSLEPSILLANMCWEYALAWQKELSEFLYLEAAIRCLEHIPQTHIKQGLYNLVWNTHLKIIFESACKLINKVGKLPKEKLCKQDTGLTDFQIVLFINTCTTFLDNFLDIVQQSYNTEKVNNFCIIFIIKKFNINFLD